MKPSFKKQNDYRKRWNNLFKFYLQKFIGVSEQQTQQKFLPIQLVEYETPLTHLS